MGEPGHPLIQKLYQQTNQWVLTQKQPNLGVRNCGAFSNSNEHQGILSIPKILSYVYLVSKHAWKFTHLCQVWKGLIWKLNVEITGLLCVYVCERLFYHDIFL